MCPSCGAKRAAAFAAFLREEVLESVCHALWTFSIPKIIRPYFLHHRELLGRMRLVGVILDPAVITAILDHLRARKVTATRATPGTTGSLQAAS